MTLIRKLAFGGTYTAAMLALTAILALSPAETVRADAATDFLKTLSGSWKGRGTARQGADAADEAILCRITSTLRGVKLSNSGNCAAAQTKIKVAGALRYSAATGKFIGNLLATGTDGSSSSSTGRLSGKSLRLKTTSSDTTGRVVTRGVVTIRLSGAKRYVIEASMTDVATGRTYRAAKITFTRTK